jgi:hypothetical protein
MQTKDVPPNHRKCCSFTLNNRSPSSQGYESTRTGPRPNLKKHNSWLASSQVSQPHNKSEFPALFPPQIAQPKEMNTFIFHVVSQAVPFLSRVPILLVRKSPYWKLQVFSVVDISFRTTFNLMHTSIHSLLE